MNQFVDECRREWKRLRVPDLVADEMAVDLSADLEEAEVEGVSAVDLLGGAGAEPRSFAAAWAAERGVIPSAPLAARLQRSLVPVAMAALTIVAAVGAALVIFASPHAAAHIATMPVPPLSPYPTKSEVATQAWVVAKAHGRFLVAFPPARAGGVDIHRVGSILLIVGIVGVILSTPLLFWSSSRRFRTARP